MSKFGFDVGRIDEGLGDLGPQKLTEPPTETERRLFDRHHRQVGALADLRIRNGFQIPEEVRSKQIEQLNLAVGHELRTKTVAGLFQSHQSAAPIEFLFRRSTGGGFQRETFLRFEGVEGNDLLPTASFQGSGIAVNAMEEVIDRLEQVGPELPRIRIGARHAFATEDVGEETLGEIPRRVRAMAASSDVSVEREPVSLAEVGEGSRGRRGTSLRRA